MFHLPDHRQAVMVWPTPSVRVASAAPRQDMPEPPPMSADGQVVEWDGFRYSQYLEGVLHFHDPRSTVDKAARPPTEHHVKHLHAPKLPAELRKKLDDIAAREKAAAEKEKDEKPSGSDPPLVIIPPAPTEMQPAIYAADDPRFGKGEQLPTPALPKNGGDS